MKTKKKKLQNQTLPYFCCTADVEVNHSLLSEVPPSTGKAVVNL